MNSQDTGIYESQSMSKECQGTQFQSTARKKEFQKHCIVSEGKMIGEKKFEILYELSQLVIEKLLIL